MTPGALQGWHDFSAAEAGAPRCPRGQNAHTRAHSIDAGVQRRNRRNRPCDLALQTVALVRKWKEVHPRAASTPRILPNQLPPLAGVIPAALPAAGQLIAVDWVVPGTLLSSAAGTLGAWVLLVEVQR